MAVPVAALAKIAAAALSDEDSRKRLGWIVAAICSPLILTLALICSLLSGSAEHNNSAVLLCFHGGDIPGKTPAEYKRRHSKAEALTAAETTASRLRVPAGPRRRRTASTRPWRAAAVWRLLFCSRGFSPSRI